MAHRLIVGLAGAALGAALLATAPAAWATEAAALEEELRDILAAWSGPGGGLTYRSLAVEEAAPGFRATLGNVKLLDPAGSLSLGTVTFDLRKLDGDRYAIEGLTLPSWMPFRDAEGVPAGSLTLKEQRFEGVWSRRLAAFLAFDAAYRGVRFQAGKEAVFGLDGLQAARRSEETEPGLWDQRGHLALDGLRIATPAGALAVETLRIDSADARLRLERWPSLLDALAGAATEAAALAALRQAGALIGDSDNSLRAEGIELSGAAEGGVAIEWIAVRLAGRDLDAPRSALDLHLDYAAPALALALLGEDPVIRHLAPYLLRVKLDGRDLPLQAIWQAGLDLLAAPGGGEAAGAETLGLGAAATVHQLLEEAGSHLQMRITAELLAGNAELKGAIEADPAAAFGAVANLELAIIGLDDIIAGLERDLPPEESARWAGFLDRLRRIGERETIESGPTIDRYDIRLSTAGALLVNGSEAAALFDATPE